LVFTELSQGSPDIWVIDVKVGIPHRLTKDEHTNLAWNWSRDGRSIYFFSDRSGDYEVYKIPANGGEPERLTYGGGFVPIESMDGASIFFAKLTSPRSVWQLELDDRRERLLFEADIEQRGFSLWENKIIYLLQDNTRGTWFESYDLETGEVSLINELGIVRLGMFGRHSVSPDGRWIIFTKEDGAGSDLMWVAL
jgi:TolB protein